jgi:DNA-directed RNA polymerase specialized sigma24 family protein
MASPSFFAEFREIIVLRDMEDYSYKETADTVAVPVGTVCVAN